ncbi:MAG: DNA primase small subunit domain-containing protein [Candidatus Thorarchaeota archaeon]|jgi:DNA primase small subunit
MPRGIQETKLLQLMFQDYYRNKRDNVVAPDKVYNREFGMESWEFTWRCIKSRAQSDSSTPEPCGQTGREFRRVKKCPVCGSSNVQVTNWTRHIGFRSREALLNDLITTAPHSVYHSAAFYAVPVARHMDEKGWQGAELVFDIDADHLDLPCSKDHDLWRCNNPECFEVGAGKAPDVCPKCNGQSFSIRKWICDKCLTIAKQHTLKLYDDFLVDDFGVKPNHIQLNYSGHRGYHIRVKDPRVFKLGSEGRVEVVHYISGMGLDGEKMVMQQGRVGVVPNRTLPGWSGKLADAMIEFIRNIDSYDGNERWVKPLKNNRSAAIKGLSRQPPVLSSKVKYVGLKSWQEIAVKAAPYYGGEIDVPVTHDIHRIIRLIGSLNGKTGFTVNQLTRDSIDDFDPFSDAIGFSDGLLKVKISKNQSRIPQFRIGNNTYGPFENEVVELPMAPAIFLVCKGVATVE